MGMWDQKIPSYIYGKQNIVRLILWTALFALVFINIYKPFSSTSWYKVSEFKFFVFSSLIILTGVLVVVLSRIILFHWGSGMLSRSGPMRSGSCWRYSSCRFSIRFIRWY